MMRRLAAVERFEAGRSRSRLLPRGPSLSALSEICQLGSRSANTSSWGNRRSSRNRRSEPRYFSSSGERNSPRHQLAREDAEKLRNMRSEAGGKTRSPVSGANDGVDYRYRESGGGGAPPLPPPSVSSLWGEAAKEEELERREKKRGMRLSRGAERSRQPREERNGRRKFASFFDEVDAMMEEKYGYGGPAIGGSAEPSLLDMLGGPSFGGDASATSAPSSPGADLFAESKTGEIGVVGPPDSPGSGRKSIFDVIPAATAHPKRETYDRNSFEQYQLLLQDAIERMKRRSERKALDEEVIEWLSRDERVLPCELRILDEVIKNGGAISAKDAATGTRYESIALREQLEKQREKFMEVIPLSSKQLQSARTALKVIADFCARRARAAPVEVAWEKIKEAGMIPSEEAMNTFLYVVSTGGLGLASSISTPLHSYLLSYNSFSDDEKCGSILDTLDRVNPPDGSGDAGERRDIKEEVSVFRDILYEPTERSISVRINSLIAKGDPKGAESLLDAFKSSNGEVRLRTFLPILKHYCERGNVSSALSLFKRMRNVPTVFLEPETYVLMISTVAKGGFFRVDAEPIEGATDIGYSAASGPELFDELASEMAEDVLEITSASARRMYNALAAGFKGSEMAKDLQEMHSLAGMPSRDEAAEDSELVASRVTVDGSTAVCPRTGATLRLIVLGNDRRRQLHDSLLDLSKTAFEQLHRGQPKRGNDRSDSEYAVRELSKFSQWLDKRTGPPFTAIVDGANVAYYMQNFDDGRFNYHQVQFVVDALLSMKENPLVVVPYKYTTPSFPVNTGMGRGFQRLAEKEKAILDELIEQGRLWKVPPRCLDDLYWMLASISDQTESRKGADLNVSPHDEEGRWPGTRPMLVSNDQMRDHKLELMEPRLYRRWYSCHIVNYNFTAFVDDECVDREIGFSTPDFFSREIQGNPSLGRSDGGGGTAWHFPVSDWDLNDRFCVRIPRKG